MATEGASVRGSEADREAYDWARSDQGYEGTWAEWCEMPLRVRMEYEEGATGGVCSPKRIVAPKTAWTHKVVKKQRGADGNWFKYPAAMTGTLDEADKYAKKFAEDQTGKGGRITQTGTGTAVGSSGPLGTNSGPLGQGSGPLAQPASKPPETLWSGTSAGELGLLAGDERQLRAIAEPVARKGSVVVRSYTC